MTSTATARATSADELRTAARALAPSKLAHVVFLSDQPERLRDFYLTFLNARVAFEDGHQVCFLAYDDEHHRLGIIRRPEGATDTTLGHVSFTYDTLGELFGTWLRLRDAGIEPFWTVNHGPTLSFYYKDPDGNHLELQVDSMTNEETDAYFAAGHHERNPIGVIFDPAELLERYLAGEDEATILARPELPEGVDPFSQIRE